MASKSVPRALQERPRALQEASKSLQEPLRCLQEPSCKLGCNLKPFYIDFDAQKEPPGPRQSLKFIELSSKIKVSPLSAGSSYSNPLGHPLGALLAPNWLPRWPQEPPRRPQDGSKTHQDASKQAPGALQDPSNNAKELSRAAKRRPGAPRDPPGIDFDHSRGPLGVDLDPPGGQIRGPTRWVGGTRERGYNY